MILGYMLFFLMGLSLGVFGGGGAILSLPILVYFFDINVVSATQYSLFLVGAAALVGFLSATKTKVMPMAGIATFLIPSFIFVYFARNLILPAIPVSLKIFGSTVPRDFLMMISFSVLMLISGMKMLSRKKVESTKKNEGLGYKIFFVGAFVGLLAGILGAGGGFLIVPALVLLLDLDMKVAIKSSLLIIALQSLFGFAVGISHHPDLDVTLLVISSLVSSGGIFLGTYIAKKTSATHLKLYFGVFILLLAVGIASEQIYKFWLR